MVAQLVNVDHRWQGELQFVAYAEADVVGLGEEHAVAGEEHGAEAVALGVVDPGVGVFEGDGVA